MFIIRVAPNWLEFELFNSKLLGGREEKRFKRLLGYLVVDLGLKDSFLSLRLREIRYISFRYISNKYKDYKLL